MQPTSDTRYPSRSRKMIGRFADATAWQTPLAGRPRAGRSAVCNLNGTLIVAKIAFLGLGAMGFPMAGHLAAKGNHDVTVYNRTVTKAHAWAEKFGGKVAATAAAAAAGQDFVFACVGNDDDLREVTTSTDGA